MNRFPHVLVAPSPPDPTRPAFLVTVPRAPHDDEAADLDALTALEAANYDRRHSLGRIHLRELCTNPRNIKPAAMATPAGFVDVPTLRLVLTVRPPKPSFRWADPLGFAWLEIFADPPADTNRADDFRAVGAVQITRLTVSHAEPYGAAAIVAALLTVAADPPAMFSPPQWTAHPGRRPLIYFAPRHPQPSPDLGPILAGLGFDGQLEPVADAFGTGLPATLWIHRNGTPGSALTISTHARP